MKKTVIACLMLIACLLFSAHAFALEEKTISYDVGITVSDYRYEEPGLMKNKGVMSGVFGSVTYLDYWYWTAEGTLSYGLVDYTSANTGSSDDEDNFLAELRLLGGVDLLTPADNLSSASWSLIPYTGIAYRYLNNDSSGQITTTGHYGYERESNYVYSPVGIEVTKYLGGRSSAKGWSIGARAEYDIFWWGRQISRLSDVNPNFSDVRNTQNKGYGARGSVKLRKEMDRMNFVLEPFITYWNIKKSKEENIYYGGTIWGYGYEPKNETTEIGIRFALEF